MRSKRWPSVTPRRKGSPREYEASDHNTLLGNGGNIFCWRQWLGKSTLFHWAMSLRYDALTSSSFHTCSLRTILCVSLSPTCGCSTWPEANPEFPFRRCYQKIVKVWAPRRETCRTAAVCKGQDPRWGRERTPGLPLRGWICSPSTLYLSIVCWFFNNVICLLIFGCDGSSLLREGFFLVPKSRGYLLFVVVCGLLIEAASLVAGHRL